MRDLHKIYETQRNLFKLEQGNDYVELYFHKLKGFWDELRALEPIIKCRCETIKDWEIQVEKTRLKQFLIGLHSSYIAVRGHVPMVNPWPFVNQAFMLIKQEEKQRQTHSSDQAKMKALVLGNMTGGLYQFLNSLAPQEVYVFTVSKISSQSLWHQRLGHIPSKILFKIPDLDVSSSSYSDIYNIFPLAKQCKLSFSLSQSQTSGVFELLHCDVWGPYKTPNHDSCNYFLTIVDDFSRAIWIILLPTKHHVVQSLQDFFAHVETHFHFPIKSFKSVYSSDKLAPRALEIVFVGYPHQQIDMPFPPSALPFDSTLDSPIDSIILPDSSPSTAENLGNMARLKQTQRKSVGSAPRLPVEIITAIAAEQIIHEPYSYNQAITDDRRVEAMNKELNALESNDTWFIVPIPPDKKIVGYKWVYKVKYLADGSLDKFKTLLVAKGYTQVEGQDYHSTFAPIAKIPTVRIILALATVKN
ncbi:hypothetical protein AgCh_039279 [Apium graveolens]